MPNLTMIAQSAVASAPRALAVACVREIEALGALSDKSRAAIARGAERNAENAP